MIDAAEFRDELLAVECPQRWKRAYQALDLALTRIQEQVDPKGNEAGLIHLCNVAQEVGRIRVRKD